jgi:hypothetical protein
MKPIRTIIHGAVVTIHSDYISVSVTRFVSHLSLNNFDFNRITTDDNGRFRATYSRQKSISEINDIDTFVDDTIAEFKRRATLPESIEIITVGF